MHTDITARHLRLTPALKAYITSKAEKFEHYFKPIITVHVILNLVKSYLHVAEITIQTRHAFFSARAESRDMYASVDLVLEKMKKQLKKQNEKAKSHKPARDNFHGEMRMNILGKKRNAHNIPMLVRSETFPVKPMNVEDAIKELNTLDYGFLTFYNINTEKINVVYRRSNGELGVIEPEF